jgi:hypothetical protein
MASMPNQSYTLKSLQSAYFHHDITVRFLKFIPKEQILLRELKFRQLVSTISIPLVRKYFFIIPTLITLVEANNQQRPELR